MSEATQSNSTYRNYAQKLIFNITVTNMQSILAKDVDQNV